MTLISFRGEHLDSLVGILASDLHQTGPRTDILSLLPQKLSSVSLESKGTFL